MGAYINALREEGTKDEILHELMKWMDKAEDAQARIAALTEALEHYACNCGPHQCEAGGDYQDVTCGHCARAALAKGGE